MLADLPCMLRTPPLPVYALAMRLLLGLAGVAAAPSADEPVWIGGVKQLFVDDSLIAASSGGLERVMNPPAKLGRRVVQPDAPWERALNTSLGLYSSVMREGNTTRLWYFETREGSEDTGFTVKRPYLQAYAISESDGSSDDRMSKEGFD